MNKIPQNKLQYLFPVTFMVNAYAMTFLMMMLGLFGKPNMAAEIGIVQGATVAIFYAFSADSRSLIFNKFPAELIIVSRLYLLIPLAGAALVLSCPAKIDMYMAIILIIRRCIEWLGEVHLCEKERLGDKKFTWKYLILQVGLLIGLFAWFLCDLPSPLLGLFIWAVAPLLISIHYIWKSFVKNPYAPFRITSRIMPNLGSTTIIGITVYVFRLLILLIVGKNIAGELFTAFAIGGMTGGVFANALGPSVVLHEKRSGKKQLPILLNIILYISLFSGVIIFMAAILEMPVLQWMAKSNIFWMATGLSMIGGFFMVHAQRIRLRLLQDDKENNVFGPDVLMNVLLISAIPFAYYLVGIEAMSGLYLMSSLLALAFYSNSKSGKSLERRETLISRIIKIAIPVVLLFPVFFQISNGLFRDKTINYNSGGVLANLPIPFSVLICYLGIIFLGKYKRAFVSITTIFFTSILLSMAVFFSAISNPAQQQAKFILLIQFILPMFALILGQRYSDETTGNNDFFYEKLFLCVLAIIIPWHLIATYYQGFTYLAPSLGLFSIYQSFQYVPVILVSAYVVAFFALWQSTRYKIVLLLLAPLMAVYVSASMSLLAVGLLLIGLLGFAVYKWIANNEKLPITVFLLVTLLSFSYFYYVQTHLAESDRKLLWSSTQHEVPRNIHDRIYYWQYYTDKIVTTPKILLIGSNELIDRTKIPSAHNYFLDYIYNFGLLALLPILILLIYTCALILNSRRAIYTSPGVLGLCFVTLFLLLIDNFFKVGLRQPYPGIFAFFLWGVLLDRLLKLNGKLKDADPMAERNS